MQEDKEGNVLGDRRRPYRCVGLQVGADFAGRAKGAETWQNRMHTIMHALSLRVTDLAWLGAGFSPQQRPVPTTGPHEAGLQVLPACMIYPAHFSVITSNYFCSQGLRLFGVSC